jgi:alpha-beta hydrolase superfamily lysophospholipase
VQPTAAKARRRVTPEPLAAFVCKAHSRNSQMERQLGMKWTNLLALISLLGVSGCTPSRRDVHADENFRKVDVGGYGLRMLAAGKGSPTVVLESGLGGGIESWQKVQSKVAQFSQVVAYEHAGAGGSDPGPKPRTGRQIAKELRIALKNAAITPPYVLVGHSIGGPYVHIFASLYPNEVAGIVLVDPTQERSGQRDADAIGWLKLQRQKPSNSWKTDFKEQNSKGSGVASG